jgi:general secretion pathway protein K
MSDRRATPRSVLGGRALPRARQRGVALVTAVLIVALATILAVDVGFKGYLDQRRTATTFALDQGFQIALGAEAWAADILRKDKIESPKTDDFTELWATPIPPIPVDGGEIEGLLEDMQGRFNINSLVRLDGNRLVVHQPSVKRLERLLELLELETKWATLIADWIDSDNQEQFPDGAEDGAYTALMPPYRTANMPITRTSELLALEGFGLERFQRLEPFITALPVGTKLNLCTAPLEVLDSLVEGNIEYSRAPDTNNDLRKERCFPNKREFQSGAMSGLPADEKQELDDMLDETSNYFRATVWVTIGTTQFTLYSLLYRTQGNQVRPILRSFGTT